MLEKFVALVIVVTGIVVVANLAAHDPASAPPDESLAANGSLAGPPSPPADNATTGPPDASPTTPTPDRGLLDILTGPLGSHSGKGPGHDKRKGHG